MLTLRRSPLVRACAILVVAVHVISCSKWEYVPNSPKPDLNTDLLNQHVLFTEKEKTWDLYVMDVKYPFVRGPFFADRSGNMQEVDLRRVTTLQVFGENGAGEPVHVVNYQATLNNKHVKFMQGDRTWDLYVKEIAYPMVRGPYYDDKKGPVQEVDLRNITGFSVLQTGGNTTTFVILGIVAAIVIIAVVAASGDDDKKPAPPPPTTGGGSSSCPVLYVCNDRGMQRIGEGYAGAAFRSLQRDDLLPLPYVAGKNLYCLLVNEANETQYTDALDLVVVDHPRGTRAVATVDQKPILVGDAAAPLSAVDATGANVLAQVAVRDSVFCQTDWEDVAASHTPRLQETITASFAPVAAGANPVLEIELANSYWLEAVIGNVFQAAARNFHDYMTQWNQPSSASLMHNWMQRQGVTLTVEEKRGGTWHEVAVVQPPGAMEMRHVAIELPAVPRSDTDPIEVRLNGGTGFWIVDDISLSARSSSRGLVRHVKPANMIDENGEDQRPLVASVDGRFQVLEQSGERLPIDFELPRIKRGSDRSVFLFTNGYYNVHAPDVNAPPMVSRPTDRPGALAEIGIDIYRQFQKLAQTTPRRAEAVTTVEP